MTPDAAAAVLGVRVDATHEQIEAAYRAKARESHPDRGSADAEAFVRATEARDVLLARPMVVAPPSASVPRWSWRLFAAWVAVILVAVFVSTFRAPEPLGPIEPVLRYGALGGALVGYALTGRRVFFWLAVVAAAWVAFVTLAFTSFGPLVGLLLLIAPFYGLTLLGRARGNYRARRG